MAVNYQNYLTRQNHIIRREYTVLEHIRKEEEKKKEEILEAKKESLSIEKLKEITMEEYRREASKENEMFIEEFVSNSRAAARGVWQMLSDKISGWNAWKALKELPEYGKTDYGQKKEMSISINGNTKITVFRGSFHFL